MPTSTTNGGTASGNIVDKLAKNPLRTEEDVQIYVKDLQRHLNALWVEVDTGAATLELNLREGNHGIERFTANMKARKTARALRKVSDHLHAAQTMTVKFWSVFRQTWDEILHPRGRTTNRRFDFRPGK